MTAVVFKTRSSILATGSKSLNEKLCYRASSVERGPTMTIHVSEGGASEQDAEAAESMDNVADSHTEVLLEGGN